LLSILDHYLEYFKTPYFIFVRDTLSYLALLGLHFAVCLQPSTLKLTVLEWLILVFFLGRLLMEIDQVISGMIREEVPEVNSGMKEVEGQVNIVMIEVEGQVNSVMEGEERQVNSGMIEEEGQVNSVVVGEEGQVNSVMVREEGQVNSGMVREEGQSSDSSSGSGKRHQTFMKQLSKYCG
jgi:hypothetical protein